LIIDPSSKLGVSFVLLRYFLVAVFTMELGTQTVHPREFKDAFNLGQHILV
jgi:hypothetical protein